MMKRQDILSIGNKTFQAVAFVVAVLLQGACTSDYVPAEKEPIRLSASAQQVIATRAATNLQDATFNAGTRINAYIKDITNNQWIGNPILYTASAANGGVNALTPDKQPYYPTGNVSIDVYAYSPSDITLSSTSFSVSDTQTTDAQYIASDLMFASITGQAKTDQTLNLGFTHKMAKFIITATGGDGISIESVKLKNVYRTVGLSSATAGTFGSLSNKGEVTLTNGGAALIPPQEVTGELIEVATNKGKAVFSLASPKMFEGGCEYTAQLEVTQRNIGVIATITDWNQDLGVVAIVPSADTQLTVGDIGTYTYDGTEKKPTPTVSYNGSTKTKDTDYTLLYYNNINAGTATLIVMAKAGGTLPAGTAAVKSFIINQATGALAYPNNNGDKTVEYDLNNTVDNTLSITGDGTMTYTSGDEAVATVSNSGLVTIKGVGTTTISASMASDKNYTGATASYKLIVNKRAASRLTVTLSGIPEGGFTYWGGSNIPGVTVKDGDAFLEENKDYTLTWGNTTNAGNGQVTVNGVGVYTGSTTQTFTIKKATTAMEVPFNSVLLSVGTSEDCAVIRNYGTPTYTVTNASPAGCVTVNSDGVVTAVAAGTATVSASIAAGDNWTAAGPVTISVTSVLNEKEFSYSGKCETWTCNVTGRYKLECWGASGAGYTSIWRTFAGGKGAYVCGTVKLNAGDVLYVYVGGQGAYGTSGSVAGGWNGGGGKTSSGSGYFCSGGGATDIALNGTNGSATWNENKHLYTRIIVAAGGGGSMPGGYGASGGYGGAWNGQNGTGSNDYGRGGTLSGGGSGGQNATSGSFGVGGSYSGTSYAGAGGGGWYGGGSGGDKRGHGAGGGGSSYMWNSSNASYYPTASGVTKPGTGYYVTEVSKVQNNWTGNGKAKISFVSVE